jgi:hypothetical protein
LQEEKAPVALGDRGGQRHADALGVRRVELEVAQVSGAGRLDLGIRERVLRALLDHRDERGARIVERGGLRHLRAEEGHARFAARDGEREDLRRLALLDEGLAHAPRRGMRHDPAEHLHRGEIGVRPRRDVVARDHELHVAHAAHRHQALSLLRLVEGVEGRHRHGRPRDLAELARHQRQRLRLVELARDDQHGVVGAVPLAIERLQALDRHVLQVGARADRGLAVVMPVESRRLRALDQDARGVVLAALQLVAHHRHLGVEVLLGDEARGHRVGRPAQEPVEVVVVRGPAREVVGAVGAGRAVGAHAPAGALRPRVGVGRRAEEDEVLEQVRHPRLAVVLVLRAHEVGDVDRGGGFRGVGREQDSQAVGEVVLGDALDGGDAGHALRQGDFLRPGRERGEAATEEEGASGLQGRSHFGALDQSPA